MPILYAGQHLQGSRQSRTGSPVIGSLLQHPAQARQRRSQTVTQNVIQKEEPYVRSYEPKQSGRTNQPDPGGTSSRATDTHAGGPTSTHANSATGTGAYSASGAYHDH
jgi:hypothetical protein